MKKNKSKEDEFIIDYFKTINLEQCRDKAQLSSRLYGKYDKNTVKEIIEIMSTDEYLDSAYFYQLKSASLELSIDVSSYFTDLYRQCFKWLINRSSIKYDRVLDIGCDNGIVTCFLAILFPQAEIIGIDISENGITCARDLAEKLNLTNVRFINMDFLDISKHFGDASFDLIISVQTIGTIAEFNGDKKYWSIRDYGEIEKNRTLWVLLSLIKRIMKNDNSELITFDKLNNPIDAAVWVDQLMELQLFVDWKACEMIDYHEIGIEQKIPVIVSNGIQANYDIADNIIKLYTGIETMIIGGDKEFEGITAELAFDAFTDKEFVDGLQLNYTNGLGSLRYELWREASQLLLYQYSDIGYRKLSIISIIYLDQILEELNKLRDNMISGNDSNSLTCSDIRK